jgi:hypothetical protein
MPPTWENEFADRMRSFETGADTVGVGVSLKVRVTSGCYHRSCSPQAFEIIDGQFASDVTGGYHVEFMEHETGPEVLALVTAGIMLTSSVIDLVVSILRARGEGIRRGDRPSDAVELIIRRFDESGTLREEKVLRVGRDDQVDPSEIERQLNEAVERVTKSYM